MRNASRHLSGRSRPLLASIIAITLGAMAVGQIVAMTMLLVFGRDLPQFQRALSQLSLFDWISVYALAGILAVSMINLFRFRDSAASWFLTYAGLSSWASLFYSLTPRAELHFDEIVALAGLLAALSVLAYIFRLKRAEILK
jgi:tellurite resistance protein TehA-like permease